MLVQAPYLPFVTKSKQLTVLEYHLSTQRTQRTAPQVFQVPNDAIGLLNVSSSSQTPRSQDADGAARFERDLRVAVPQQVIQLDN